MSETFHKINLYFFWTLRTISIFFGFSYGFVAKCTKFHGQTQRTRNKYWLSTGSSYSVNPHKCTIQTYFRSYWIVCTDPAAFGDIQCPQEGEQRCVSKGSAIKMQCLHTYYLECKSQLVNLPSNLRGHYCSQGTPALQCSH